MCQVRACPARAEYRVLCVANCGAGQHAAQLCREHRTAFLGGDRLSLVDGTVIWIADMVSVATR